MPDLVQEVHLKEGQVLAPTEKHRIPMISSVSFATKFHLTSKTEISGINLKSGAKLVMFSCQWTEIQDDIEVLVLSDFLKKALNKTAWMIVKKMAESRLKVKKLMLLRQNKDPDPVETVGILIRGDDLKDEGAEEDTETEAVLETVDTEETVTETEADTDQEVEAHPHEGEVDHHHHEEEDHQVLWEDGTTTEETITIEEIDGMITIAEIVDDIN